MKNSYGFPEMATMLPETPKPEGEGFFIQHMAMDEEFVDKQRHGFNSDWTTRGLEPGTYCILRQRKSYRPGCFSTTLWMSDTWMERMTNIEAVQEARGDVLVVGLGLGMVTTAMCQKESVHSVTVLELYPDLVRLVEPHIRHPKLQVIIADGKQPPFRGRCFDTVWLDIWPNICTDNWEEMKPMLRDYRKLSRKGAFVSGWMKEHLQELVREGRWR